MEGRFSFGLSCLVGRSSFDYSTNSSLPSPVTTLILYPSLPPLNHLPLSSTSPCSVYITPYLQSLGYSFLTILPQPISFKPRLHPPAFSPLPHRRFITLLSRKINPSQLNNLYRIDSRIKLPQRPSSHKVLHPLRPKPVPTVKPLLLRYGVEMPRVNPFVTPVVSVIIRLLSFSRVWNYHPVTHLTHVSDVSSDARQRLLRTTDLSALTLGPISSFLISHCIGYADVPSPLYYPHVQSQPHPS